MIKKISFLLLMGLCTVSLTKAQITVTQGFTIEEYVNDLLLGNGVSATNIQISGNISQIGYLEGGDGTIFTVDSGLVMSTSDMSVPFTDVAVVDPLNVEPDLLTVSQSVPDLIGIEFGTPTEVFDVAIIEFDFVPLGDTIKFNFVFGSDEYLTWVETQFNDIFSFFLSGPGLSGPYDSPAAFPDGAINIAQIPDTDPAIPITISSVNPNTNPEFYIDNPGNTDIGLNGFTTKITAQQAVTCGETYHIKFAIADAGDPTLESAVVLESGSFISTGIAEFDFEYDTPGSEALNEASANCNVGTIVIERPPCQDDSLYLHLEYSGVGEYGVDYEPLVTDTIFLPGEDFIELPMVVIPDGIDEPDEIVYIEASKSVFENGPFEIIGIDSLYLTDGYSFVVDNPTVYRYCPGDSANIAVEAQYPGIQLFEYTWSQNGEVLGEDSPQLLVPIPTNPFDSAYYNINVVDGCGMTSIPDSVWIVNVIPLDPTAIVEVNGEYCRSIPFPISANVSNGSSPFTFDWSDGGNVNPNMVTPAVETEYTVIVTDACGRETTATGSFPMPDPVTVAEDLQDYVCLNEVLELGPVASGGQAPYDFGWGFDQTFGIVNYDETTGNGSVNVLSQLDDPDENVVEATLIVKDYCQVQRELLGIFDPIDQPIEYTDTIVLLNCIVPNVITPNGDDFNNSFQADELLAKPGTMFIYDRWGKLLSESSNYSWDAGDSSDGTYFYVVAFDDGEVKKGSFTILR